METEGDALKIKTKIENGYMLYEGRLPMVLGVSKEINTPRFVSLMGVVKAQGKPFTVWSLNDLELETGDIGLAGSPTQPGNLKTPPVGRKVEMLDGDLEEKAGKILEILHTAGVLN
jgi:electron transfer flavoprotein beta subunit